MNKLRIETSGTAVNKWRGKAVQLFRALERQRIKLGKRHLQMVRYFGSVRIKVRSTTYTAGNIAWITGGGGTILLFSDPRIVIDPFWDYSGGYACEQYDGPSPYTNRNENLETGLTSFFPFNNYPLPSYHEELLTSISVLEYTFSFSTPQTHALRVQIKRDGTTLYSDYILGRIDASSPLGPGWLGDWVINSRPYPTATIDPWISPDYGYVNMGVVGCFTMSGKMYTFFYETAGGIRYWYLLGFSHTDGSLVEDYLLSTNISDVANHPMRSQPAFTFVGNTSIEGDDVVYVITRFTSPPEIIAIDMTVESGDPPAISPVEATHSLAGLGGVNIEMRNLAVTAAYVYVLTREFNGVDYDMVVHRAPRFTTEAPVWTTILSVTTDGTWHFGNNSIYCITVSPDDSELSTVWREGNSTFATTQRCYWKTYNISGVPDTPASETSSIDSVSDPTHNIIGLKYLG